VARETASRVRSRIEIIINAAKANALADNSNPERQALWGSHHNPAQWAILKYAGLHGRQSKSHFAAMPWTDVPHFAQQLKRKDDYSARALLLTILCATRSSETLNAEWSEFDLDGACWTIPRERMKGFREHRVPLSSQAVELLRGTLRMERNSFVFPGAREARPLSNMAMLQMLRGMRAKDGFTVHGFRSAFRDWAGETTLHPDNIAEQALAHIIGDKTTEAYRRENAFERRRILMQQWGDYLFTNEEQYKVYWEKFLVKQLDSID
jgi:integrase